MALLFYVRLEITSNAIEKNIILCFNIPNLIILLVRYILSFYFVIKKIILGFQLPVKYREEISTANKINTIEHEKDTAEHISSFSS